MKLILAVLRRVMQRVKITYNFNQLKGKPKRIVESTEGCTIKSYGVNKDSVTLIFLTYTDEALETVLSLLRQSGVTDIKY